MHAINRSIAINRSQQGGPGRKNQPPSGPLPDKRCQLHGQRSGAIRKYRREQPIHRRADLTTRTVRIYIGDITIFIYSIEPIFQVSLGVFTYRLSNYANLARYPPVFYSVPSKIDTGIVFFVVLYFLQSLL